MFLTSPGQRPTLILLLLLQLVPFAHAQVPEHVFYYDGDQDSFGDANFPIPIGIDWLPNRYVTYRAGDPDDGNNWIFPTQIPRGERRIGTELLDVPESGIWQNTLFDEVAFDAVTVRLPWSLIESAPGEYNGSYSAVLAALGSQLPGSGISINLSLDAIDRKKLTLPDDLIEGLQSGSLRLSDPAIVGRFAALLEHVHAVIGDVPLVALTFGHEIDLMFSEQPDLQFWIDFQVFYFIVSNHARSLWGPDLKVGLTATHDGLINPSTSWLMGYLNTTSNIVSMTYFPVGGDFEVVDPSEIDISGVIEAVSGTNGQKPIHIEATGYPSGSGAKGSQMKQSQFLYKFFDSWDAHASQVPFVSFFRLHDADPAEVELRVESEGVNLDIAPAAAAYLGSLGLRSRAGNGQSKTGYSSLRNLVFERGWWREREYSDRPYLMGFTPELFDFPPTQEEVMAVEAFLFEKMDADGDFINVHMDSGIPWVEAAADTFESPVAPYSANVLETWAAQAGRIPPDSKVMVSINPLGIPRAKLAAYWGVGEEFSYQQEPPWGRIPLGSTSDGAPRIPPAPWDTYGLADEPVRQAFVNYARRIVEYFDPDYLLVGIEVSATQVEDEAAWQDYKGLHQYVYSALKQRYPDLPILLSFSGTSYMTDEFFPLLDDRNVENGHAWKFDEMAPGVRERLKQGLQDILPYTDIVAFSVYPHFGKYNAYQTPASMWDQLFAILAEVGAANKPIAISESGYSADPFSISLGDEYIPFLFAGSPEKQERFLKLMFYELRKASNPVEFVVNYQVRDGDLWWQRLFSSEGDIFNQFYQYFRDIGLYAGDGSERPATVRWKNEFALPIAP